MEESAGHAFISYVREDSDRVDWLQQALEAAGVSVWRDTADLWPGQDWRMKIRNAITDNALVFIACSSSRSAARTKSYQNEELTLAIEQLRLRPPGVPWLIPVRFDDCPVPDIDLGGGRTLRSIQRADLFGDRREAETNRLVTTARRLLEQQSGEWCLRAEKLGASRGQLPPGVAQRQQRAQAGMVHVWEEYTSHDRRLSPAQRAAQGRQPGGDMTAHLKNSSDQPVYEVILAWHKGSEPWGDIDNLGTLIPGHEAERTRRLPALSDHAVPDSYGVVAYFRDPTSTWWCGRPDGMVYEILPELVPRG